MGHVLSFRGPQPLDDCHVVLPFVSTHAGFLEAMSRLLQGMVWMAIRCLLNPIASLESLQAVWTHGSRTPSMSAFECWKARLLPCWWHHIDSYWDDMLWPWGWTTTWLTFIVVALTELRSCCHGLNMIESILSLESAVTATLQTNTSDTSQYYLFAISSVRKLSQVLKS